MGFKQYSALAAVVVGAFWALACAGAKGAVAQRASTMIVLDGSNSMNARLPNDKSFKFVTVREGLRSALAGSGGGTDLGLTTFGARRTGDCSDVEVAVAPDPDQGKVMAALERFQPRGFSPVVLALRTAAKALPAGGNKASIVLVLDDLASCRGEDPCKVATDLKQQNPALVVHVVGLALRPQDQPVLACIARQTGGQLLNAVDGAGVAPALQEAMRLASVDRQKPVAPAAAVGPATTGPAAPAQTPVAARRAPTAVGDFDEQRPGVHLSARLAEGGAPIATPVRWRIWTEAGAAGEPPIFEAMAPVVSRVLADGRYVVEAQTGLVSVRRPFEVASQGATPVRVVLNAGLLEVSVPLINGGSLAPETQITISAAGKGPGGSKTPLWIGRSSSAEIVVPGGDYHIAAVDGLARAERTVVAVAGATSKIDMPLGAGRLQVSEPDSAAGAAPPQLVIETDDPDTTGGRRELLRTAATRLVTTLPVGSFLVTLRRGAMESRERVAIRPGETAVRNIVMPIARVRLSAKGAGQQQGAPFSYRIERIGGGAPVIQRWGEPEVVLDMMPGRYRFEARLGAQNAVVVREAELRGGFETRLDLDAGAGTVRLKLAAGQGGLGLGMVYWQIFDERGAPVWRSVQAEPVVVLVAGRYRIKAEAREKVIERMLDVRAGDSGQVEIEE